MGTRGAAIGVICGRGRVAQCQISEITYFKKQNKKNTQAGRFVSPPPPTPGVMPSYLNALASEGAGGLTCGLGGPTVAVLRARGPRGPAGPIAQQIADPTCNEWQRERCTCHARPGYPLTHFPTRLACRRHACWCAKALGPRPARAALVRDTAHTTRARNNQKCQYTGGPFCVAAPPTPSR